MNNPSRSQGFTLIELMVGLTIMAVMGTILVKSASGLQDQARYDQTVERVTQIKQAIINTQTVNGVPVVSGFVADMGRLPYCLQELLDGTCPATGLADATWGVIGTCVTGAGTIDVTQALCNTNGGTSWNALQGTGITSTGWHGPYIQTSNNPAQAYAFTDGWGTIGTTNYDNYGWNYFLEPDTNNIFNIAVILQSYGSDGVPDTTLTTSDQYKTDYPAALSISPLFITPIVQQKDWQFNLGSAPFGNAILGTLAPTNITISLQALGLSSYTTSVPADLCSMTGGTFISGSGCTVTKLMCNILGGAWNSSTTTCTFNAISSSALCVAAGGSAWATDSTTCYKPAIPYIQSSCQTAGGAWNAPLCTFMTTPSSLCQAVGASALATDTAICFKPSPAINPGTCTGGGGSWTSPVCTFTSISSSTLCTTVGGSNWASPNGCSSSIPPVSPTSTQCTNAGYSWDGATCTYALPLQSLCEKSGGAWINPATSTLPATCTLTMDQVTCNNLTSGTGFNITTNQCKLTVWSTGATQPTIADTCQNLLTTNPTAWNSPTCALVGGASGLTTYFPPATIVGLCTALGGFFDGVGNCTVGAPLLSVISAQCFSSGGCPALITASKNICLNVFYRDLNASTPIVVATALGSIPNDGKTHSVSFSGFSVYDLTGATVIDNVNTPPLAVPIPAGQNAISVTQADTGGGCSATSYTNAPYPANHPAGAVPQIFRPGLPLVFNW